MASLRNFLLLLAAISAVRGHFQDEYYSPLSSSASFIAGESAPPADGRRNAASSKNHGLGAIEFERIPPDGKDVTSASEYHASNCQLTPIVHLLNHPGCQTKAISSFACSGSCPSYVQTSTSRIWQHERSCSCCQQTGSQEATFTLDCPSLDPPYKKVKTYAPMNCMCRSCTDLGKEDLRAHELVEALAGET